MSGFANDAQHAVGTVSSQLACIALCGLNMAGRLLAKFAGDALAPPLAELALARTAARAHVVGFETGLAWFTDHPVG